MRHYPISDQITKTFLKDSGTKVERKPSNRSVNFEEDELRKPELPAKPQFKSGTPIRGSTFQRSTSEAVIVNPTLFTSSNLLFEIHF